MMLHLTRRILGLFKKTPRAVEPPTSSPFPAGWVPVSRHGLQDCGVVCPRCGEFAAEPGDWRAVHRMVRPGNTYEEEAISCRCGAFLVASPDDDIDPLVFGEPYDVATYHTFVKPDGFQWPINPRTLSRPAVKGDWIVVLERIEGARRGAEGWVTQVNDDGTALLKLGAFMSVSTVEVLAPLSAIAPVYFDSYVPGDEVEITCGPRRGERVTFIESINGIAHVSDAQDATLTLPPEHIRRPL